MKRNVFELLDHAEIEKLKLLETESGNDLPDNISLDAIKGKVYRDTGLTPTKRKRQRVFKITAIVACLAILITGFLVFAPLKRFPKTVHTVDEMIQKYDVAKIVWRENTDGSMEQESGIVGSLVGNVEDIYSDANGVPQNGVYITASLGEALRENGLFDYYAVCMRQRSNGELCYMNFSDYGYYTVGNEKNYIMIMTGLEFMKFSFGREGMLSDQQLVNLVFDLVPASFMGL